MARRLMESGRLRPFGRHSAEVARLGAGGLTLLFAFTTLYVAAFHAPRAKGLDVGVVGGAAQATRVQSALDAGARGSFDVRRYDSEAAARAALLATDVHGVVVPGERILVAGAFGALPTQAVSEALRAATGTAAVDDVRPLPSSDRRGLSSLFTVVGTLIPSLVFGVLVSIFGRALPGRVRWSALTLYAVLAGLVVALDVDVVLGALDGQFAGVALVSGLLALAACAAAHGLARLAGSAGIVAAIGLLLLLGVSSAGGAVTYQMQPGFFGALSQLLPPGAALTALRNVEYFDWAATLVPLLVLGGWAAGGLACGLLGELVGPHTRADARA
jgi:hypothetical protein